MFSREEKDRLENYKGNLGNGTELTMSKHGYSLSKRKFTIFQRESRILGILESCLTLNLQTYFVALLK